MFCLFCKIIVGEIPSIKVLETENVLAFLDISPIEKGHIIVVPKRHWESLDAAPLDDPDAAAVFDELTRTVRLLTRAARTFADGANVLQNNGAAAGQTVWHLHFHIIPRYGDGSVPPAWKSGAGQYDSDEERAAFAEKIRLALKALEA